MSTSFECRQCERYKRRIKVLETQVKRLQKGKASQQDTLLPPINITKEHLNTVVNSFYSKEIFQKGVSGLISFIYQYIVRDSENRFTYRCSDPDKKLFIYYIDGTPHIDCKAKFLLDSIASVILDRATLIYKEELQQLYSEETADKQTYNSALIEVSHISDSETEEEDEDTFHFSHKKVRLINPPDTVEEKINELVSSLLSIRKTFRKNRRVIIDDLAELLYL